MYVHVTGGAGFIGSALVERLVGAGHDVTVLDNVSRGVADNLADVREEITFVEADATDRDAFAEAVGSPDVLYHLAAVNGTKNFYDRPAAVLETNIEGVRHATDVASEHGVDRLVFASSSEVYGFPREFPTDEDHVLQLMDPENPRFSYAGSKIVGEQYVVNRADPGGYDYSILRPHNVYGPAMGYDHVIPEFVEQIVTDEPFTIYGDGTQTRSFCYISDAVDGFVRAGVRDTPEGIYNVGTQDEIEIRDLAERLFDVAGVHPGVEYVDSVELEGSTPRRQPDVSRARERLGYDPEVGLREGLERTFAWYCEDLTGLSPDEWRAEHAGV